MCAMSGGEQAAPSPDALTTQGKNGCSCDRCLHGSAEGATGELYSQEAGIYPGQQLLQQVTTSGFSQHASKTRNQSQM